MAALGAIQGAGLVGMPWQASFLKAAHENIARSPDHCCAKAQAHDKHGGVVMPGKRWTGQEVACLDTMYPIWPTDAVARLIEKPIPSVQKMAQMRGLKKTPETLSVIRHGAAKKCPNASGRFKVDHGRSGGKDRTYTTWQSMHRRCYFKAHKSFNDYGGRGITVCERWSSFNAFFEDMGERPVGRTLGRKDNEGNYTPENCVWETAKQQARNRRSSRYVHAFGEVKVVVEWCEQYKIAQDTFNWRLKTGMTPEAALSTPVKHYRKVKT